MGGCRTHSWSSSKCWVRACCFESCAARQLVCIVAGKGAAQLQRPFCEVPGAITGPLAAALHHTAGCAALCTLANLVTKVAMKLMSTHFHKEAHFQRMQEALRKVGDTRPPGSSATHRRLGAGCLCSACLSVHVCSSG